MPKEVIKDMELELGALMLRHISTLTEGEKPNAVYRTAKVSSTFTWCGNARFKVTLEEIKDNENSR